ncbi:MAG: UDP-N-acetylglucosamine 2-epimerase [Nitrospirota bacterium]
MHSIDTFGYLEFKYLAKHARGVMTDSEGITEQTTVLGVSCLPLRDSTERTARSGRSDSSGPIQTNRFPHWVD